MKKEELLKVINALPEDAEVDIDITPANVRVPEYREPEIRCYQDLIDKHRVLFGFTIDNCSDVVPDYIESGVVEGRVNIFEQKHHAEAALAIAQISQVLPYYCEPFTEEEWQNPDVKKFVIGVAAGKTMVYETSLLRSFPAFRTKVQAETFARYNEDVLIKANTL